MSLRTAIARSATAALLVGATVAGTALATARAAEAATTDAGSASAYGYWASLAVSQRTGRVAVAYDYATSAAADAAAVRKCGNGDCGVVVHVTNGCVALAQARNGAWRSAWGASRAVAERTAIAHTAGSGARILAWACTSGHR